MAIGFWVSVSLRELGFGPKLGFVVNGLKGWFGPIGLKGSILGFWVLGLGRDFR